MELITQKVTLKHSQSVRESETQDGAVLLDIEQGQCFSMNPVAALIWKQLGQGCDPIEIAQNLSRTFDISLHQAGSDVQELIQRLTQLNLLRGPKVVERKPIGIRWLKIFLGQLRNLRQRKNAKDN
jgi:hypothetical protein